MIRGELDLAQRLDENLLGLSHQRNDSAGLVLGHHSSGRTLFYRGRFASSRSHQEEALRLYDPISQRSLVVQAGFDPRVGVLGFLGLALFCLGFPDQALARSSAAIAEARRLAHASSLAVSLSLGTRLFSLFGDNAALDEQVDQLVAVTTPPLGCAGNGLSRVGYGQKWRCDGGDIASADWFDRLPCRRVGGMDPYYTPVGWSV